MDGKRGRPCRMIPAAEHRTAFTISKGLSNFPKEQFIRLTAQSILSSDVEIMPPRITDANISPVLVKVFPVPRVQF